MIVQDALFSAEPKYCIDTNVVVSFLRGTDDEHYGADVFRPQWQFVERCMQEGKVIAPRQVEAELEKWQKSISQMHVWLRDHRYLFRDMDDAQLNAAKRIVNAYPAYGMTQNNVGDLELMTLAMARGIAVLTLEHKRNLSRVSACRRSPTCAPSSTSTAFRSLDSCGAKASAGRVQTRNDAGHAEVGPDDAQGRTTGCSLAQVRSGKPATMLQPTAHAVSNPTDSTLRTSFIRTTLPFFAFLFLGVFSTRPRLQNLINIRTAKASATSSTPHGIEPEPPTPSLSQRADQVRLSLSRRSRSVCAGPDVTVASSCLIRRSRAEERRGARAGFDRA